MLWLLVVRHSRPLQHPALPWWVLAPAFLATERWPVELHFRRSSHSFSLSDILLTVALVFCSGGERRAGHRGGTGALCSCAACRR